MINIHAHDIMEIRKAFMKQRKIPTKIHFPVHKYDCKKIWTTPAALPGKIFGIEIKETLYGECVFVEYKSAEEYRYE